MKALIVMGTWLAAAAAGAQQPRTGAARISGVVRDTQRVAIAGATVRVLGTGEATYTDSTGGFALPVASMANVLLEVRRLGFLANTVSVDVRAGEARLDLVLRTVPSLLAPQVVRAPGRTLNLALAGFEQRRAIGRGQFASAEEFRRYGAMRVSDVLLRFHSLRIADSSGAKLAVSTRGEKITVARGAAVPVPCVMRTAVDGELMPYGYDLDTEGISNVAAIEVYAGAATIPAQFNGAQNGTMCGLVMLWLR